MLFNLGNYEVMVILVVALFFVGLPLATWFLGRRRAQKVREKGR